MPCGQEAAAGGEEVIWIAEPDAAELSSANISALRILNHSSLFSSHSLWQSDYLFFHPCALPLSQWLFRAQGVRYAMSGENTFFSYVISGSGRITVHLPYFPVGKQAWLQVDILVPLCRDDFGKQCFTNSLMEAEAELASSGCNYRNGSFLGWVPAEGFFFSPVKLAMTVKYDNIQTNMWHSTRL